MSASADTVDLLLAQAREKVRSGQFGAAMTVLDRALALRSDDPMLLHTRGLIACGQGNLLQGVDYFRRVLEHRPDHPEAYGNLGLALTQLGELDEAILCFERALAIDPASCAALCGLGGVCFKQGAYADSAERFRAALRSQPDSWDAAFGLGNALLQQGDVAEALRHYRQAAQRRPNSAATHFALAAAAFVLGRLSDAITACRNALARDPTLNAASVNLAIYKRYACDWEDFDTDEAMLRDRVRQRTGLVPPFAFLHVAATAAEQLHSARQVADGPAMRAPQLFSLPRAPTAKIRLGYLSSDFRNHATAHLTAELFERHDRSRFDIIGYSLGDDDGSAIRRRLIEGFDDFVDLRREPTAAAAQRIHADGIHILVDLNGYAQNGRPRIMTMRPAPVQVNYLGYPGTMGARFIDYIIVDPVVAPADQQNFFTERLVHLPECYQANDSRRAVAEMVIPSRSDCGLPETGFVFCCFNNPAKITPTIFALWMRLLHALPDSRLWLLQSNALMAANLHREAAARGIAPARLVFAPPLPLAEHRARHRHADLMLDTLPYGAHTTMSDALWAGVPAVTCLGATFAGRVGGSLLRAAGLPELVTESLVDYENLARRLASRPRELAAIRDRLRHKTALLFDTVRFTRHIEAAYARMWEIWCAGGEPESFAVSPELPESLA